MAVYRQKKKSPGKVILDFDKFWWEACKGMESNMVDPNPYHSMGAVDGHLKKFIREDIFPVFVPKDRLEQGLFTPSEIPPIYLAFKDKWSGNFRKDIYPEYKSNRTQPRPLHEKEVQNFLLSKYKERCLLAYEEEADDTVGRTVAEDPFSWLIVHTDGDLRQLEGYHLEPQIHNQMYSRNIYTVHQPGVMYWEGIKRSEKKGLFSGKKVFVTGIKCFWYKMIAGDTSDGAKFLSGYGPTEAYSHLAGVEDPMEMCEIVKKLYMGVYRDNWEEAMTLAGQVFHIRQYRGEMWQIPY